MAREPPAEARVEIAVARVCELICRAMGAQQKISVLDFLPYLDAWSAEKQLANDPRYSDVDREVIGAFIKG